MSFFTLQSGSFSYFFQLLINYTALLMNLFSTKKPTSLAELRSRAAIDQTDVTKYAIRRWVFSVNRLYEEGDNAIRLGDIENAYVYYMKGCSIMLEIIKQHPEYSTTQRDPFYVQLRKRTNSEVINILEDIGEKLQVLYNQGDQQLPSEKTLEDGDPDLERTLEKYPPLSSSPGLSALDNLPPVPDHVPSLKSEDNIEKMTNDMSKGKGSSSASLLPKNNSNHLIHSPDSTKTSTSSTIQQPSSSSTERSPPSSVAIHLPPRSNNIFPKSGQVEPLELAKWITRKDNPASILILDVRPRDMFRRACIKHKWMVQIEPLVLRKDTTSYKVQDSLVLNPEAEQQLFEQRHMFDLVVLYDQNSPSSTQMNLPIKYLKDAIYELEFAKTLPCMPIILAGGFDAWVAAVGPRGVYCFDDNKKESESTPHITKPFVKSNQHHPETSSSYYEKTEIPVVNHDIYDYFSYKQRSGQLQSMSRSNQVPQSYQRQQPFGQYQYVTNMPMPVPASVPVPVPTSTPAIKNNAYGVPPVGIYNSDGSDGAMFSSRYPEISPNISTPSSLQRQNTFIDNPFHGFTATSNNIYDIPPIPAKPTRPLPQPPSSSRGDSTSSHYHQLSPSPVSPTILSDANSTHKNKNIRSSNNNNSTHFGGAGTNSRIAPVSGSSFSQLGGVLIGTTGLKNLGNTCYMNSIIQCLSGTLPFARYFISGMFKQHINKQNPLGTGGVLAEKFAELLRVMWSENYNFISPVTFREALVRFAPQYSGTEQQDSQEFLNFLLDGIHEDLNAIPQQQKAASSVEDPTEEARFEQLPDYQASALAWEKYMARNASVVVSLFQGQYRSRLSCLTCKTTSTTYNTFMSLSLPIPSNKRTKLSGSGVSLYQCLDFFVKEEILEKSEAWRCPKCQKLRKASKTLTLSKLPDVLLIHLKRFSFDGPFRNKLETSVDFPTKNLDLTRYVPKTMIPPHSNPPILNYDLYAVSNHYGSLTGGHYTACVRNGYRGEWHNFDDTRFSVCDESKVKGRAAYNLFYVRSTVK
ncbi:hypothetical protein BC941DRAFT_186274 [Chlamydoabsidia padenii]|nr:hypothetical protein BC941DRAFT_186274 [Chlamydoabsidia padenii]